MPLAEPHCIKHWKRGFDGIGALLLKCYIVAQGENTLADKASITIPVPENVVQRGRIMEPRI